jgi:hypothetical protein
VESDEDIEPKSISDTPN